MRYNVFVCRIVSVNDYTKINASALLYNWANVCMYRASQISTRYCDIVLGWLI